MEVSLLQISDLHYRSDRAKKISVIRDSLIRDISGLGKSIDMLIIAGDIVEKGENSERAFEDVIADFITPIKSSFNIKDDNIFIVPGNHDIDRSKVVEQYERGFDSINSLQELDKFFDDYKKRPENYSYLVQKFKQYLSFKTNLYINRANIIRTNLFYDVAKVIIKDLSFGVICLNSAWRSSQFGNDSGKLILGRTFIEEAADDLKDCNINIAVAHHPLDMLADWDKKEVTKALASSSRLFLAGHLHDSDSSFTQYILGSFFASTCSPLYQGRNGNGYSLVSMLFPDNKLSIYLREWYADRGEFDQQTAKCIGGHVEYDNFNILDKLASLWIRVNEIKANMRNRVSGKDTLMPLIYIDERANIEDVFVEPIITDHSSFEKNLVDSKIFKIKDLLNKEANIIFFGGKEYGKTILLDHIKSQILSDDVTFHCKIPILLKFSDISKNNPKTIIKLIRDKLSSDIADEDIQELLLQGSILFLIDDFNDPNDDDRERRKQVFLDIYRSYPKCRLIFAMNEDLSHTFKQTAPELVTTYKADSLYLQSFNTSKIRELLIKWNKYKPFDVDAILTQIVFYFNKLKIPITPLAVTLFMGALFIDPSNKGIKNEAYLIEKYLETILEKLNKEEIKSEMDFHDKETFLSHIALILVRKNKFKLSRTEFVIEKDTYFFGLGLDIPNQKIIDDFFDKGILQEVDGQISFKFGFWFNYFLAIAMHKDHRVFNEIIRLETYLKYSRALSYKAGLTRNDLSLVKIIDGHIRERFKQFKKSDFCRESYQCETTLNEFSGDIEKEIREKNRPEIKDKIKDAIYLSGDTSKQEIEDEEELFDGLIRLVLLHSEIIRNTTNILKSQKEVYLARNVSYYVLLLWKTLAELKTLISSINYDEIQKAIWGKAKNIPARIEIDQTIKRMKDLVYKIIPLSIIICMTEYLSNPKLSNTVISLLDKETDSERRLFYTLLLLKLDFERSIPYLRALVKENEDPSVDVIIFQFLYFHAFINILSNADIDKVVKLLDGLRKKLPPAKIHKKDTFVSDIKRSLLVRKNRIKK